jgi:N-acetylglutamate synthase-like GNAT family acetyltransferase
MGFVEAVVIRLAIADDLDAIKALADRHKRELGFVRRGALLESITHDHLLVAELQDQPVGFVQFHHRRDRQTTIHLIVVDANYRRRGVAGQLLDYLQASCLRRGQTRIGLKCPVDLSANDFYRQFGFTLVAQEAGKIRALNLWQLPLQTISGSLRLG